ncbi:MAG TPA: YtxH domain-containing protein [Bryobacteraceae bacterium]|jgi:gas vesicle protein
MKNNFLGFAAGLGFGAGLALLYAPRSGVRTRVLLARKARKSANYVKRQANTLRDSAASLRDTAAELLQKGQQEALNHKEGLARAVEIGKRTYFESVG